MIVPFEHAIKGICNAILRRHGAFSVTRSPTMRADIFALSAGSHEAMQTSRGVIVSLTMTRAQLKELRDDCDTLLEEHKPSVIQLVSRG